jgi:uncharacterized membrane protein
MADPVSRTAHGDAPLSTARQPDVRAMAQPGIDAQGDEELIGRTVSINRPRRELYEFWRDFHHLPMFMHNIVRIDVMDAVNSHWVVAAPAGNVVEWNSIITEDVPGESIAWESSPGADVRNSGRVEFKDQRGGRGTAVTATILYQPPAGAVGKWSAKLFQEEPRIQARRDLRRFKQLMETGEVARTSAQASGRTP